MESSDPADLDIALRDAEGGEEAALGRLLDVLARAELLVLVADQDDEGVDLLTFEHEGQPYVPAFTSEVVATSLVPPDQALARIDMQTLASSWPEGTALAINPGTVPGGWLEDDGVRSLAGRDAG